MQYLVWYICIIRWLTKIICKRIFTQFQQFSDVDPGPVQAVGLVVAAAVAVVGLGLPCK